MRWRGARILSVLVVAILASGCYSAEERRRESLEGAAAAAFRGDLDRAEQILRKARGFDPRDALVTMRLGLLLEERGSFGRALRLLEGFADEVESREWLNLRARLLLRCGRDQEAARIAMALEQAALLEHQTFHTFSEVVVERGLTPKRTGPLPDPWHLTLVEGLLRTSNPATALLWMEQVSDVGSTPDEVLGAFMECAVASDSLDFVRRVDRLIAPAESAMEALVHRRALVLAGKETAVAGWDSQFLARFPDHPGRGEILVAEARRNLARGKAEEAMRFADEALSLDWSDGVALVLRGLALEWSGQTEEAEKAYRAALAVDPDNRMARESLRSMQEEPGAVVMRIESLKP